MAVAALALLVGCTLDITGMGDPPGDSVVAVPARLQVLSQIVSRPSEDGLGFLSTVVELRPGIDEAGEPRVVVPRPLGLHGAEVQPEVRFAQDGLQLLRWQYQDSISIDVATLRLTPPAVPGLPSPPEVDMQVGIRVEPEGGIALGPSEDLVLEFHLGGEPPGYLIGPRAHWSLRVGTLVMYSVATPASPLIVPSGWLAGTEFPATLELSFSTEARPDPDLSPPYLVEIRTMSVVQRRITKRPD